MVFSQNIKIQKQENFKMLLECHNTWLPDLKSRDFFGHGAEGR